jgi:hypothetical protein
MTQQDSLMFDAGFVRLSVIAKALGLHVSTVFRRVQNGRYHGERAGNLWYVKVDDVLEAQDTSLVQRTRLQQIIGWMR